MRIANLEGRLVLRHGERLVDVERASHGRFAADPQAVYEVWDDFCDWSAGADLGGPADAANADTGDIDGAAGGGAAAQPPLQAPVPRPRQVFAIGLNYADHAQESTMDLPSEPSVFTKFPSCLTGPASQVTLPTATVDWEAELVVVIGRGARRVPAERGWDHVAGLTVGQDLSERTRQLVGAPAQFSVGKSFPGFGPTGPELVTVDELDTPDDLAIGCSVNGEVVQSSTTANLIFSVPVVIERLSAILPLLPGDLIFTGTPSGVGHARDPKRYLRPGDRLDTWIEGVGRLHNTFAAPAA